MNHINMIIDCIVGSFIGVSIANFAEYMLFRIAQRNRNKQFLEEAKQVRDFIEKKINENHFEQNFVSSSEPKGKSTIN